ncbi:MULTISPECIES: GatB/YqeY domain-containing protein [Rhodomicrobium]|uniref:GatB/YqeY domain-containing protein n=1 Tax=Rhodomicrobium TaxID=1068 RepID=UPI000B4B03C7|nr:MULTISPECIES: GatB/YqeY domain-containing protein [Rhodomicrobium]
MIRETISAALKDAMKSKNEAGVSTIRMINAAIKQKDIDVARPRGDETIADEEVLSLLQAMIKSRREAIEMFRQGNRDDLIQKETAEIGLIEQFLPRQLGAEETEAAIAAVIAKTGAASVKDMGKVMAALKADYAGQLDMSRASALVKQQLSGN